MAGIGFSLKKLFQKKGVFNLCRAYGYAGLICAGPMILGVILLAFGVGQAEHQVVFRKAVTICMECIGLG